MSTRQGPSNAPHHSPEAYPRFGNHYMPRTRQGWTAVILFVVLLALAQPPVVHRFADRIDPWLLGFPFLYVYLLVIYIAMIGVLVWAQRRDV